VAAVAAMLIPAALGRSSEAVVKGALEDAEEQMAEPHLSGERVPHWRIGRGAGRMRFKTKSRGCMAA